MISFTLAHESGRFTVSVNPSHVMVVIPADANGYKSAEDARTAIVLVGGLTYQVTEPQESVLTALARREETN